MGRFRTLMLVSMALILALIPARASDLQDLLDEASRLAPLVIDNEQIGMLFAQGVEKQYGLDRDPRRTTRVQTIGSSILSSNHIKSRYDFAVLATHDFNACSIYGGHIRVNEGLLFDTQNNDAEAAFAIAHEIAHNELGHNKEAVRNFKIAYALELANMTEKLPKLLVAGTNAALAKRSRENESAADLKALEYMQKAGYKTTGAIAMARRIEAEHKIAQGRAGNQSLVAQRFNAIFDTHPDPARRAEVAEDFYFTQKYGSTFKQVKGGNSQTADSFVKPTDAFVPSQVSVFGSEWLRKCDCGVWMTHCGVDVDLRTDKQVRASAAGAVKYAGSFGDGWGDCVVLEHQVPGLGAVTTLYGHIAIESRIKDGEVTWVTQGQLLGKIDQGIDPPHLHFGVRLSPYDGKGALSRKGALYACSSTRHQPKFPEHWYDPLKFLEEHKPGSGGYTGPGQVAIIRPQFHLGDDVSQTEMVKDATFNFGRVDATLKMWIKGSPFKDPIIWINRHEVGRVVTTDGKWHRFTFRVPAEYLNDGQNLLHMESFIPDRWHTFDDCEVKDVWIVRN